MSSPPDTDRPVLLAATTKFGELVRAEARYQAWPEGGGIWRWRHTGLWITRDTTMHAWMEIPNYP